MFKTATLTPNHPEAPLGFGSSVRREVNADALKAIAAIREHARENAKRMVLLAPRRRRNKTSATDDKKPPALARTITKRPQSAHQLMSSSTYSDECTQPPRRQQRQNANECAPVMSRRCYVTRPQYGCWICLVISVNLVYLTLDRVSPSSGVSRGCASHSLFQFNFLDLHTLTL